MKKILLSLVAGTALLLTGCLETTQEITLKEDGSGTIMTTSDMGQLISMAKNMGGGEKLSQAAEQKMDTVISMEKASDSIPNLTAEEKEIVKKGSLRLNMDLDKDVFKTTTSFSFTSASQLSICNKLAGKMLATAMKDRMGEAGGMPMGGEMPEPSSIEDYYTYSMENGEFSRKLIKDKYDNVANDQYLQGMQQAAQMGLTPKTTYIITLPRPAKEVEGKRAKLSDDKMKVTIEAELDDFFATPSLLEFKIKY
jgi:hypothetical protein